MFVVYLYDRAGAALAGATAAAGVSVGGDEQLTPAAHSIVRAVNRNGARRPPGLPLSTRACPAAVDDGGVDEDAEYPANPARPSPVLSTFFKVLTAPSSVRSLRSSNRAKW